MSKARPQSATRRLKRMILGHNLPKKKLDYIQLIPIKQNGKVVKYKRIKHYKK